MSKKKKYKEPTLGEIIDKTEKLIKKGYKPHFKGSKGKVKFEFD